MRFVVLLSILAHALAGEPLNVAIVGGGVGGAATAMFLREALGDKIKISVFEVGTKLGGRTATFDAGSGRLYEGGATIIYSGNAHTKRLVDLAGLTQIPAGEGTLGVWTGEHGEGGGFVMGGGRQGFVGGLMFKAGVLTRYAGAFLKLRGLVNKAARNFDGVYALQQQREGAARAAGAGFRSPLDLWGAVGLSELTTTRFDSFLNATLGLTDGNVRAQRLVNELVHAMTTVNYNQPPDQGMSALAGIVGMIPLFGSGSLFAVGGGNARLSEALFQKAGAQVHLRSRVAAVVDDTDDQVRDGKKETAKLLGAHGETLLGKINAVFVAAPTEASGLSFGWQGQRCGAAPLPGDATASMPARGGAPLPPVQAHHTYQRTVATFVEGVLNSSAFFGRSSGGDDGSDEQQPLPDMILLTAEAAQKQKGSWSSIRKMGDATESAPPVYRFFSKAPLGMPVLESVFRRDAAWRVLGALDWGGGAGHGAKGGLVVGKYQNGTAGGGGSEGAARVGFSENSKASGSGGGLSGKLVAGAYPQFDLPRTEKGAGASSLVLDDAMPCGEGTNVYYASALEPTVSALEVSVVGAKNAVNLFLRAHQGNPDKPLPLNSNDKGSDDGSNSSESSSSAKSREKKDTTRKSIEDTAAADMLAVELDEVGPKVFTNAYSSSSSSSSSGDSLGVVLEARDAVTAVLVSALQRRHDVGSFGGASPSTAEGSSKQEQSARRGLHVLDAGCGPNGLQALSLRNVGGFGRITGLDSDPQAVASAAASGAYANAGGQVSVVSGDLQRWLGKPVEAGGGGVASDAFDAAVCGLGTLEVLDPSLAPNALDELARVVRPGGVVVVTLARDDAETARWQREGSEAQRWHAAREALVKAGIWEPIDERVIEDSGGDEGGLGKSQSSGSRKGRTDKQRKSGVGVAAYAYRVLKSFEIRY